MSRLKEECGVFGMIDLDGNNVNNFIYYGLIALQHRGQESCGIVVGDTNNSKKNIKSYKDMGLVSQVFTKEILDNLLGNLGIGHVRYSTTGDSIKENAQPLVLNYIKGTMAVAHNGNLINTKTLKDDLKKNSYIYYFQFI